MKLTIERNQKGDVAFILESEGQDPVATAQKYHEVVKELFTNTVTTAIEEAAANVKPPLRPNLNKE